MNRPIDVFWMSLASSCVAISPSLPSDVVLMLQAANNEPGGCSTADAMVQCHTAGYANDLSTARCTVALLRRFYWHELMLWPKDIPAHAIVVLSANDDLVPAQLVQVCVKLIQSQAWLRVDCGFTNMSTIVLWFRPLRALQSPTWDAARATCSRCRAHPARPPHARFTIRCLPASIWAQSERPIVRSGSSKTIEERLTPASARALRRPS